MTKDAAGPRDIPAAENDGWYGTPPRSPKRVDPLYPALAIIAVVVVVAAAMALAGPLMGAKEVQSTAYDVLLSEDELPSGWSANSSSPPDDTDIGVGFAVVTWTYGSGRTGGPELGGPSVECTIFVWDDIAEAYDLFNSLAQDHPREPPPGGALGDESYVSIVERSGNARIEGVFRVANVVVYWNATDVPAGDLRPDPYAEGTVFPLIKKQCEKIEAARRG